MSTKIENTERLLKSIGIEYSATCIAAWAYSNNITEEELEKLNILFRQISSYKHDCLTKMFLRLSRIPQKDRKTFENFDCSKLSSEAQKQIKALKTLSFIETKRNLIMIGSTGTGKTHLAQAIGNLCCDSDIRAYYIKMEELKEKFAVAISDKREGKVINNLSKYSCFIIDEVGYCKFNTLETRMFFQLIDRLNEKPHGNIILTSNKDLSTWGDLFEDEDALECILDRICDRSINLEFSGHSHRGLDKVNYSLDFQPINF